MQRLWKRRRCNDLSHPSPVIKVELLRAGFASFTVALHRRLWQKTGKRRRREELEGKTPQNGEVTPGGGTDSAVKIAAGPRNQLSLRERRRFHLIPGSESAGLRSLPPVGIPSRRGEANSRSLGLTSQNGAGKKPLRTIPRIPGSAKGKFCKFSKRGFRTLPRREGREGGRKGFVGMGLKRRVFPQAFLQWNNFLNCSESLPRSGLDLLQICLLILILQRTNFFFPPLNVS